MGHQLEDPQVEDTIMEDMDLPTVEEQNVDQDTIVDHLVLDPTDMVTELAQDHTGLDQALGFWLEYWVEDQKPMTMIL